MGDLHFQGEVYNDDRMFVLHVCRCTVTARDDGTMVTTIHHEVDPSDSRWCLVTYRNTASYPATRVDHFDSLEDARAYLERVEPTVPRVSLAGRPPVAPLPYDQFVAWKAANDLKDYDYRQMYIPGGENRCETIISTRR